MVNVPPPLLCSTPPPIDFGEEDDDSGLQSTLHLEDPDADVNGDVDADVDIYSEYGLVTDNHEAPLSAKALPLPELSISSAEYSTQTLPPDLSNGHEKTAATATKQTVEAFNYQVKAPNFDQQTPPPMDNASAQLEEAEEDEVQFEETELDEEEEQANTNDNVPSLKLDSLSLYSSESISPTCTLSPTTDEQTTHNNNNNNNSNKPAPIVHQVTLEDVSDDSDEECSPKKPKELFIPEGAVDFFAIEIVGTPTLPTPVPVPLSASVPELNNQSPADKHDFAAFQETPPEDITHQVLNEDDDDDFGDFADFSAAPVPVEPQQTLPAPSSDDGFDDFQDFATPPTIAVEASNIPNADEDDDDFGDFSEPAFSSVPPTPPVLPQPPPPAASHLSITERVKPVLELMFANQDANSAQSSEKHTPLASVQSLHFGAIEQAHALDYQWASSEMRHSLVRSLGIDSRNILFGDKWNASMPRFAANLSFDPLKPQSAAPNAASSVLDPQQASISSWQPNNNSSGQQTFEESHVQTLQLEQQQLDQVTMVANADKINLVTSNYSHNNYNNNNNDHNNHDALDAKLPLMELNDNNDNMTINNNNNPNNNNANANELHNFVTHFATICNNNNNNNNHAITTTTTTINTNFTAHDVLLDLRPEAATAAAAQTSQIKAQPGATHGPSTSNGSSCAEETAGGSAAVGSAADDLDDTPATASVFITATTAATLSPALPTDGHGHSFDDSEQQSQQQQLDLRSSTTPIPTPSPSPPPTVSSSSQQQLHEVSNSNSYSLPLKETHIYTPSKSDTAVAKTTTLAPIDFDYEIASAGIIIDETVVKKEYRDVEYKPPPYGLDSPSKLSASGNPSTEDEDFSDFQSVSALKNSTLLQPPRNGTPTFGEQMILSPAILLPQSIPLAKPSIEWGDNAMANINADELARIEEIFAHQYKPPTISATVAQQSPKQQKQQHQQQQQKQQQEDDEWSDFVSVPVQQQQMQQQLQQQQQQQQISHNNNNVINIKKPPQATHVAHTVKDDDWSDFVSSTPLPATLNSRAAPQFNSGAWQSANFYNNPLSLYQQQQQQPHSNLVPKYPGSGSGSSNNNNNNNNNASAIPQQIHMMHDFSTAPTASPIATPATYQQQHHQHHQQQLQHQKQQNRQQFHLGNAKVAPRISLIPDLSFVAPALSSNAGAFMNSLPKPSFGAKK